MNFRTRKDAEVAFVQGRHFKDRTLSVTWVTQTGQPAAPAPAEAEEAPAVQEQIQNETAKEDDLDAVGDVSHFF